MAGGASKWPDIEPILKWGAVSYACGFLIVMIHTARLGIPALQLIEPINVWIGLPIAIVLFFFETLMIDQWKRARENLDRELTEASALADKIGKETDPDKVFDLIANSVVVAFTTTFVFPSINLFGFLMRKIYELFRPKFIAALGKTMPDKKRDVAQRWLGRVLSAAASLAAVQRFVNVIIELAVIIFACFLYVVVLYPRIPQTCGGGRPMEVQLIVDAESIPRESSYFRDVLPPENKPTGQPENKSVGQAENKSTSKSENKSIDQAENKSTGQAQNKSTSKTENKSIDQTENKSTGQRSKTSTTIGVVLYYQTEDAYYVRIKKEQTPVGPIVALSSHAVEGIIFTK